MIDDVLDRILSRTVKSGDGCWSCQLSGNGKGYARIKVNGRRLYVHRVMFELFVGTIPDGLHIDHKCNNRRCCNPEHLEPVTPAENNRRANERSPLGHVRAVTHCPAGHLYTEADKKPCGRRECRTCLSARRNKRYAEDPAYREKRKLCERERYQARA